MGYILQGIRDGFSIAFQEAQAALRPSKRNIPSAYQQPQMVDRHLQAECEMGRVLGPFPFPPADFLHISRFGVIPTKS